jgi:hypothetical protein
MLLTVVISLPPVSRDMPALKVPNGPSPFAYPVATTAMQIINSNAPAIMFCRCIEFLSPCLEKLFEGTPLLIFVVLTSHTLHIDPNITKSPEKGKWLSRLRESDSKAPMARNTFGCNIARLWRFGGEAGMFRQL